MIDTKVSELKLESVPTVNDFADVFPVELLGLPPIREIDFTIELVQRTSPVSISSYRMALKELKEVKKHNYRNCQIKVSSNLVFPLGWTYFVCQGKKMDRCGALTTVI